LPLGVFLVLHLAMNARALRGDAAFSNAAGKLQRFPALAAVEWLLVFAPLALHAAVGFWLVVTGKTPSGSPRPYTPTLRAAMRVTGVVAVAFLAMHLPELRFRVPGERLDGGELSTVLDADLSTIAHGVPWRGLAYLVGTGCVTFHFAAGSWAFLVTIRQGPPSAAVRRRTAWAAGVLGAAMWITFANVVVFRATGARLFGPPAAMPETAEPCPSPSARGQGEQAP
jgi:succinate dehydrogenase / fumarate reductase, cytochrome b subunit